ncbi:MAG: NUDIX domain-containing protein [Rhodothermales bacterium]
MEPLTETTLRSEQLVDGRLLNVYRDTVRLADGTETVREWISHPGAAAVVPLFEDGSTLMVRQFRYAPRRTMLEVPAGKIDREGEEPKEVAARELEEETGWRALRLTLLGSLYPCIGYSNEVIHYYLAEELSRSRQALDPGECIEVVSMPFDEAVAMARRGDLSDMKTVTALLMADAYVQGDAEITKKKLH